MDNMRKVFEQFAKGGKQSSSSGVDSPTNDTAETVHISSLALLKMLKHGMFSNMIFADSHLYDFIFFKKFIGRAGVPMEVMGLMLGEFIDDYTVRCIGMLISLYYSMINF